MMRCTRLNEEENFGKIYILLESHEDEISFLDYNHCFLKNCPWSKMCHYITFATAPTISKSNWKPQIKFSVIYQSIRDQICFGSHCTIVLMDREWKQVGLIWFFYFVGHVLISSISWVKKTMWETIFDRLRHYWRDDVHIFKSTCLLYKWAAAIALAKNMLIHESISSA